MPPEALMVTLDASIPEAVCDCCTTSILTLDKSASVEKSLRTKKIDFYFYQVATDTVTMALKCRLVPT